MASSSLYNTNFTRSINLQADRSLHFRCLCFFGLFFFGHGYRFMRRLRPTNFAEYVFDCLDKLLKDSSFPGDVMVSRRWRQVLSSLSTLICYMGVSNIEFSRWDRVFRLYFYAWCNLYLASVLRDRWSFFYYGVNLDMKYKSRDNLNNNLDET